MKITAKKNAAKVTKKPAAKKEVVNVGFVGSFTPPGKSPVPMFYIDKEDRQEEQFHPFGLSLNKCRMLLETPGALEAMQEFVEQAEAPSTKKARK